MTPPEVKSAVDPAFAACKAAVDATLLAIRDDPAKAWLIGPMTNAYERLIDAAVLISGRDRDSIVKTYQPDPARWAEYIDHRAEIDAALEALEAGELAPIGSCPLCNALDPEGLELVARDLADSLRTIPAMPPRLVELAEQLHLALAQA